MRFVPHLAGFAITAVLAVVPAHAATTQQELMKTCNATATTQALKGDARKAYMSDCLSGKAAAAKPMTPQERMKSCNTQAAGKTGDDRKTFMSTCLKG